MNTLGNWILIVDDDEGLRSNLQDVLKGEGYGVAGAKDGKDALELLRKSNSLPSLIMLDMVMPVMDGLSFRQAQENDPRLAPIPVIVMTAASKAEERKIRLGARGILRKPFLAAEVLKTVHRFCD